MFSVTSQHDVPNFTTHSYSRKLLVQFSLSLSPRSFLFPHRKVNIQFSFIRLCSQLLTTISAPPPKQYFTQKKFLIEEEEEINYNNGWLDHKKLKKILPKEEKWCWWCEKQNKVEGLKPILQAQLSRIFFLVITNNSLVSLHKIRQRFDKKCFV